MIKKEAIKNSQQIKLTFVLPADNQQQRVSVVGDFNGWNPQALPMGKRSNGTLSASVALATGQRVRFRYYAADGQWFNDERADGYEPSEYGTENGIVLI